jgi:hypothetical protein
MAFRSESRILMRIWSGEKWGDEIQVSQAGVECWEPAIATGNQGRVLLAWDQYSAAGGYDLLLRSYANGSLEELRTVSAGTYAEMHADVAVDGSGRIWIAWEEGGVNWGKDTGYENAKHRIHLRPGGSKLYGPPTSRTVGYRRPRVAVPAGDRLEQATLDFAAPAWLQAKRMSRGEVAWSSPIFVQRR